ncbi:MAG: hypothetical protein OEU68_07545 [Nitrospira sp.]|nr:hypothetical protein [Nitrospira sp.]MDH4244640.1 hypothetical protein [Nitrospira sp.]MDH4355182.1 hypothetical protein [Nitrospira sp.]MDH5317521.1 hypothetical protein [Nitrospira sp.]
MMFRHPRYLEIPWELHWERRDKKDGGAHHHPLLTLIVILLAMLLIGVGVTSGLIV